MNKNLILMTHIFFSYLSENELHNAFDVTGNHLLKYLNFYNCRLDYGRNTIFQDITE